MAALAIVALIFSVLSIFIPVGGVFIAMLCSVFAFISFRSNPTLSGVTFGLDILNTALLSPSIMLSYALLSDAFPIDRFNTTGSTDIGQVYCFFVGFHGVLLIVAILWRLLMGAPTPELPEQKL